MGRSYFFLSLLIFQLKYQVSKSKAVIWLKFVVRRM